MAGDKASYTHTHTVAVVLMELRARYGEQQSPSPSLGEQRGRVRGARLPGRLR